MTSKTFLIWSIHLLGYLPRARVLSTLPRPVPQTVNRHPPRRNTCPRKVRMKNCTLFDVAVTGSWSMDQFVRNNRSIQTLAFKII